MDNQQLNNMQSQFDSLAKRVPDENIEFWLARDLQEPLGEFFSRHRESNKLLRINRLRLLRSFS